MDMYWRVPCATTQRLADRGTDDLRSERRALAHAARPVRTAHCVTWNEIVRATVALHMARRYSRARRQASPQLQALAKAREAFHTAAHALDAARSALEAQRNAARRMPVILAALESAVEVPAADREIVAEEVASLGARIERAKALVTAQEAEVERLEAELAGPLPEAIEAAKQRCELAHVEYGDVAEMACGHNVP